MDKIAGNVVLVTGSSSGIGLEIAMELLNRGAKVIFNSSRTELKGEDDLFRDHPDSSYFKADVSKVEEIKNMAEFIKSRYSRLDILINNAGVTKLIAHDDLKSADFETWKMIFSINVFGAFEVISQLRDLLEESQNPRILNIASVAGLRPTGSSIPYACSKAALIHMTRLLAKALAPKIKVNALAPGLIETPWTQTWGPSVKEHIASRTPLQRIGTPKDVAQGALSLLEGDFITGSILSVDGGLNLA